MAHDYTEVGKEDVNGNPAMHYAGKLDYKSLLLRLVKEKRDQVEAPMVKLGDRLPATADVWVTMGGQITRIILAGDLGKDALAVPAASVGGALTG